LFYLFNQTFLGKVSSAAEMAAFKMATHLTALRFVKAVRYSNEMRRLGKCTLIISYLRHRPVMSHNAVLIAMLMCIHSLHPFQIERGKGGLVPALPVGG
jgi:hypothetical protein